MPKTELINIHAALPCSRVNGPGKRMVIFFQGCVRGCPGCFNPDTHSMKPRNLLSAREIFKKYSDSGPGGIEGVTVSGGEPFLQSAGLLDILRLSRNRGLSSVVYTGFRLEDLGSDVAKECLELTDVLIDGGFEEDNKEQTLLARGSANQRFHLLSGRYGLSDFYMPGKVELIINNAGVITGTGFGRIDLWKNI